MKKCLIVPYITKRKDRIKKVKLDMEYMYRLTKGFTEDKYDGSHEQIAKAILKFSVNSVLDIVNFFEQILFPFSPVTLINFSLINQPGMGINLSQHTIGSLPFW